MNIFRGEIEMKLGSIYADIEEVLNKSDCKQDFIKKVKARFTQCLSLPESIKSIPQTSADAIKESFNREDCLFYARMAKDAERYEGELLFIIKIKYSYMYGIEQTKDNILSCAKV